MIITSNRKKIRRIKVICLANAESQEKETWMKTNRVKMVLICLQQRITDQLIGQQYTPIEERRTLLPMVGIKILSITEDIPDPVKIRSRLTTDIVLAVVETTS